MSLPLNGEKSKPSRLSKSIKFKQIEYEYHQSNSMSLRRL